MSKSDRDAIKGLEKQIEKHKQKLEDFIANPLAGDNKGHLKNAPTTEIREKIISSRIDALKHQIATFNKDIKEIKSFKKEVQQKQTKSP